MRIASRSLCLLIGGMLCAVPLRAQTRNLGGAHLRMDSIARAKSRVSEAEARAFLRMIAHPGGTRLNISDTATMGRPLFVVDGVVVEPDDSLGSGFEAGPGSSLGLVKEDIENVEVFKGRAAVVMFGPMAINGVIMIATKKGGPFSVASLDTLKSVAPDAYWSEVATLVVESEQVRDMAKQDTVRARTMEQMFSLEFSARAIQRKHRTATDAERAELRPRLERLVAQQFDIESRLMELEVAHATVRLALVRGQLAKRSVARSGEIRTSVEEMLREVPNPR